MKYLFQLICSVLLISIFSPSHAFSVRTEEWKEDVMLHDGRLIKINREVGYTFQLFYGDGGSPGMFGWWPDKFKLEFTNPDTQKNITWQGEQYFNPVLLDFVNGIPYLVIHGSSTKDTSNIYGCPELPYIFLKYEDGFFGKWVPISSDTAPKELQDANLSPDYPDFPRNPDFMDEHYYKIRNGGRDRRDLSHEQIIERIRKVERRSGGNFQAKIPRSYDEWNSIYKENRLTERLRGDCRNPYIPSPSKQFIEAIQSISTLESKEKTIQATLVKTITKPKIISKEKFRDLHGRWTGTSYLSNNCNVLIKDIKPLREYDSRGGWRLTGGRLIIDDEEGIPTKTPWFVTCDDGNIFSISRDFAKDQLYVSRHLSNGKLFDIVKVDFSKTDFLSKSKQGFALWRATIKSNVFTLAIADYSYKSTADQGGTITTEMIFSATLPP